MFIYSPLMGQYVLKRHFIFVLYNSVLCHGGTDNQTSYPKLIGFPLFDQICLIHLMYKQIRSLSVLICYNWLALITEKMS